MRSSALDKSCRDPSLQREARYRFHQTKIFDTFLTLCDCGTGFFRQFEIYARERLEITATFLNIHRMTFQEIRENSWSGGNGSTLRAVIFSCQMESKMGREKRRNRRGRIVAFYLLLLTILRRRTREAPDARNPLTWVREMYQKREELGLYHTLARELRLHDREYFFR